MKKIFYKNFVFFHYIKMDNKTYYLRNREKILNKAQKSIIKITMKD